MIFQEFKFLKQFNREFKKLLRKYRTLDEDFNTFIKVQMKLYHKLDKDNQGVEHIDGLGITHPKVFKATKFACRSLRRRGVKSGIRVIYAYFEDDDRVEFIEIYHKNDKDNEDRDRILDLYFNIKEPEN